MIQWFINFPEFAEFTEILFYLGKTQITKAGLMEGGRRMITKLRGSNISTISRQLGISRILTAL